MRNLQQEDIQLTYLTVCVTALPCKILITTLVMFTATLVDSKFQNQTLVLGSIHTTK